MTSAQYDLNYLKAGTDLLEKYLLSKDIYWPLGVNAPPGSTPYPRLTLGGVLFFQARAHARLLTFEQQDELAQIDEQITMARNRWRVAWEQKGAREIHSRLNLWKDFLGDYRKDPEEHSDRYRYEVRQRVQLQMLLHDSERIQPTDGDLLNMLDQLLRSVFVPGAFIWESELSSAFPAEIYWYLYGYLKK